MNADSSRCIEPGKNSIADDDSEVQTTLRSFQVKNIPKDTPHHDQKINPTSFASSKAHKLLAISLGGNGPCCSHSRTLMDTKPTATSCTHTYWFRFGEFSLLFCCVLLFSSLCPYILSACCFHVSSKGRLSDPSFGITQHALLHPPHCGSWLGIESRK